MAKLALFAVILGIASAVVVYVVAQWQVDSMPASPSSRLAGILIAEQIGQTGVPAPPAPAPRVSWEWPAITGGAVAVVVLGVGIAFNVTGKG
jgi:hypothetical protein